MPEFMGTQSDINRHAGAHIIAKDSTIFPPLWYGKWRWVSSTTTTKAHPRARCDLNGRD
ncbi:hypothetical protein ACLK19_28275 [Escherichia coli]